MKTLFAAIGLAALLAGVSVQAQTGTSQVQNLLPTQLPISAPAGADIPAFNTNGLDFTNADYKIASGTRFDSGGGVLSYWQFDADIWQTKDVDLGFGASGTLAASGTGFHNVAGFFEVLKNFSNFQFVIKVGPGYDIDTPALYGAEVVEIDYNLTSGTSGLLANNHLFTYVGANVEMDEGNFSTGGKYQRQLDVFAGIAF